MQKIIPHLWFEKDAKEASEFYTSIFPNSGIVNTSAIENTPSGDSAVVSFQLMGYKLLCFDAGPLFKFNPSISFMINFDPLFFKDAADPAAEARKKLDYAWERLSDGGTVLMPLDQYPFSARYGWIQDKYGLSWQLILTDPDGEARPPVIPSFLFTDARAGQAEEAVNFYLSVFKDTQMGSIHRYGPGQAPDDEDHVMFSDFALENSWFTAMDSARTHGFAFNEAVSLQIPCNTQQEIDYYWEHLSAVPEAEQCGWLKDKYGVSWQVVPARLEMMMRDKDREKVRRVTAAFMKMKKFDLEEVERAYSG